MDIDARIKIIMEKMEKLKDKNPEYLSALASS